MPSKLRFLLNSCIEEYKTLKSGSACRFARDLQQQIGDVQSVNRQKNGTLLIEGQTNAQITKIRSFKSIAGLQVNVEVHSILNLCKGVVTHEDFASETKEDFKSFFEPKCVVNVHGICQKVDGIFVPATTLILMFGKPSHSDRIR